METIVVLGYWSIRFVGWSLVVVNCDGCGEFA